MKENRVLIKYGAAISHSNPHTPNLIDINQRSMEVWDKARCARNKLDLFLFATVHSSFILKHAQTTLRHANALTMIINRKALM